MSFGDFDFDEYTDWREDVTPEHTDESDVSRPIDDRDEEAPEFVVDEELAYNIGYEPREAL